MLAKKSAQEMYKTFVQHKNLNEKYPENMMRSMAYFEVFYSWGKLISFKINIFHLF